VHSQFSARKFGIQELSTTVLTATVVAIGSNSRLAGGTGEGEKLRYTAVLTMCGVSHLPRRTVGPVEIEARRRSN